MTVKGNVAYNFIGVISQRVNGLSIDFHDAAVHHSMYRTNERDHTMGALSEQAVLLSTERDSQERLRLLTVIGYVAYNSIGVISQRDNGLSIDFHDAAVHHSM